MKRCHHWWEETDREHVRPHFRPARISAASDELTRDLVFGFVRVEMRCTGCGDIKFVKEHGA